MSVFLLAASLALKATVAAPAQQAGGEASKVPGWIEENFIGTPPPQFLRSKEGHFELESVLGSKRFRHVPNIWGLAFNREGTRVISVSQRSYKVWDLQTGRQVAMWRDEFRIEAFAASPDFKRVVSGGLSTLKVWDAESGKEVAALSTRSALASSAPREEVLEHVWQLGFSPDGKTVLAYCTDAAHTRRFETWDLRTMKRASSWPLKGAVSSVNFSPDGKTVLFLEEDPPPPPPPAPPPKPGAAPAFTLDMPRGLWEMITGTLKVRDVRTGRPVPGTRDIRCDAHHLARSPDGKQALVGRDHKLVVIDLGSGKEIATREGPKGMEFTGVLTPDGKGAMWWADDSSEEGTLALCDMESGKELSGLRVKGFSGQISPDGRQFVTGAGATFRLWDIETGREIVVNGQAPNPAVAAAALSSDGKRIISAGEDLLFRVWDVKTRKLLSTSRKSDESPSSSSISLSSDGTCGIRMADESLEIWDAATGNVLGRLKGSADYATGFVGFSPDGKRALSVASGEKKASVTVWDVDKLRRISTFSDDVPVESACLNLDGSKVLTNGSKLWDAERGKLLAAWKAPAPAQPPKGARVVSHGANDQLAVESNRCCFSPDGKQALCPGTWVLMDTVAQKLIPGETHVWDVATGNLLARWKWEREEQCTARAYTQDGKHAILAGPGTLALYDARTGRELDWIALDGGLRSLTVLQDRVVVGGCDGTVSVYRFK